ncbi:MAG TPA: hypothetical protein VGM37_07525 [Armatimonadota bacterium]
MIELELPHGKARVWFDPLDVQIAVEGSVMERTVACRAVGPPGARYAGIEYFCPADKQEYAVLGAQFRATDESYLRAVVLTSESSSLLPGALASRCEVVRTGLPLEYADSVLEVAADNETAELLGCGVLSFVQAAHAEASSSCSVFQRIARSVVRVLALGETQRQDDSAIRDILTEHAGRRTMVRTIPAVVADITFLSAAEAGRASLPTGEARNYRPHLVLHGCDPAEIKSGAGYLGVWFRAGRFPGFPGVSARYTLACMYHPMVDYSGLKAGAAFWVYEGGTMVANGIVVERTELALPHQSELEAATSGLDDGRRNP